MSGRVFQAVAKLRDTSKRPWLFLLLSACTFALLRLLVFDYWEYFQLRAIPNHDMYQGAALFCTNMHSIRLSGDLAWWVPTDEYGGYAQYYNAFLCALAPTNGHILFILWTYFIRLLGLLGLSIPEYYQYLALTFVILPFFAYLAISWFAFLIFRSRSAVLLLLAVYCFSGIGLWNSAWFYYQEPATVFFLIASFIAMMQRPSLARGMVVLSAVFIQIASANYWTLYDTWFVFLVLITYSFLHRSEVSRLLRHFRVVASGNRALITMIALAFVAVIAVWTATLGAIVKEQGGVYVRSHPVPGVSTEGTFSTKMAFDRVQEMRTYTIALFDPKLDRALTHYKVINEMHNARYIGATLIPFVLLFLVTAWNRRAQWLALVWTGVLAVCMVPGWLLTIWGITPLMNHIQHQFYFYSHFFQLATALVACWSFDRLMCNRLVGDSRNRLLALGSLYVVLGASIALLGYLTLISDRFAAKDASMESLLMAAVLTLFSTVFIIQALLSSSCRTRTVLALVIVCLSVCDLSRYYWEVSMADQVFTHKQRYSWLAENRVLNGQVPFPLLPAQASALRSPWKLVQHPKTAQETLESFWGNMPVANFFWPRNRFNPHRHVLEWMDMPEEKKSFLPQSNKLVVFFGNRTETDGNSILSGLEEVSFSTRSFRYNDQVFEVEVPRSGWLFVRRLYDPNWKIHIDGSLVSHFRANYTGMAIGIPAGKHTVEMEYKPISRQLYPVACWLLIITLIFFASVGLTDHSLCRRLDSPICEVSPWADKSP